MTKEARTWTWTWKKWRQVRSVGYSQDYIFHGYWLKKEVRTAISHLPYLVSEDHIWCPGPRSPGPLPQLLMYGNPKVLWLIFAHMPRRSPSHSQSPLNSTATWFSERPFSNSGRREDWFDCRSDETWWSPPQNVANECETAFNLFSFFRNFRNRIGSIWEIKILLGAVVGTTINDWLIINLDRNQAISLPVFTRTKLMYSARAQDGPQEMEIN